MNAIKKTIILCWIMLIVCFIIKLFGGNWFEIICNNEHFIYVCGYIDSHWFVRYPLAIILYILSLIFVVFACADVSNISIKQVLFVVGSLIIVWSINFLSPIAKFALEVAFFIASPILLNLKFLRKRGANRKPIKKLWYRGIIGYIAIVVFQILSVITRNIGVKVVDNSTLVTFILMIDYYIMVTLFCLYIKLKNKKEVN